MSPTGVTSLSKSKAREPRKPERDGTKTTEDKANLSTSGRENGFSVPVRHSLVYYGTRPPLQGPKVSSAAETEPQRLLPPSWWWRRAASCRSEWGSGTRGGKD